MKAVVLVDMSKQMKIRLANFLRPICHSFGGSASHRFQCEGGRGRVCGLNRKPGVVCRV